MPIAAPDLTIQHENLGHKLWDAVGGEDIDFESDEFSRRFWVKCGNRRFAYDVIHPAMMEWLLANRGWQWQWHGRCSSCTTSGKLQAASCKALLHLLLGFQGRLPRHLVSPVPPSPPAT